MVRGVLFLGVLFYAGYLNAQPAIDREKGLESAHKIAQKVIEKTSYRFVDRTTGKTYTSLKGLELNENIRVESPYNDWHYTNGVLNIALLELADRTGEKKYEQYVKRNFDFVFNEGHYDYFKGLYEKSFKEEGWLKIRRLSWHMIFRNKRLDDNGTMAASLIELQKRHPHNSYMQYIQSTDEHMLYYEPRLVDGTIARLWPHEKTIWADDLYMSIAFLARMGNLTGDWRYFDDAANQIVNFARYLWNNENQLYYHCYHSDTKTNGVAFWGRANGWVAMAHADLLSVMPKDHPLYHDVVASLQRQIEGVSRHQGANGLWHQVLNKPDSYEEVTCTAMFTFTIARGVKNGWIHPDFIQVAAYALKGILTKISDNGDLTAICTGTGISPSLSFYYNRPVETNTAMGQAPVLRALVEMSGAPRYKEISADEQYDKIIDQRK
jgi:rhamnogalacturonyl hydrolase YesR